MSVLICRPQKDAESLAKLLYNNSINAICIPTIDIVAKSSSVCIDDYTDVIFTSKYAVEHFDISTNDFAEKTVWAIGTSTANELLKYGINASFPQKSNSKELFELITKDDVSSRKFLLLSGESGSDFLIKELSKISLVDKIEVYKRVFRSEDVLMQDYKKLFLNNQPNIIITTSIDVFKALNRIFEDESVIKPKNAFITISSAKMLEYVSNNGFKNTLMMEKLDNAYICQQVCDFLK